MKKLVVSIVKFFGAVTTSRLFLKLFLSQLNDCVKLDEKAIKWITREKGKGTPTREIAKIERITIEELIGSVSTTKKQEKFLGQARL